MPELISTLLQAAIFRVSSRKLTGSGHEGRVGKRWVIKPSSILKGTRDCTDEQSLGMTDGRGSPSLFFPCFLRVQRALVRNENSQRSAVDLVIHWSGKQWQLVQDGERPCTGNERPFPGFGFAPFQNGFGHIENFRTYGHRRGQIENFRTYGRLSLAASNQQLYTRREARCACIVVLHRPTKRTGKRIAKDRERRGIYKARAASTTAAVTTPPPPLLQPQPPPPLSSVVERSPPRVAVVISRPLNLPPSAFLTTCVKELSAPGSPPLASGGRDRRLLDLHPGHGGVLLRPLGAGGLVPHQRLLGVIHRHHAWWYEGGVVRQE